VHWSVMIVSIPVPSLSTSVKPSLPKK